MDDAAAVEDVHALDELQAQKQPGLQGKVDIFVDVLGQDLQEGAAFHLAHQVAVEGLTAQTAFEQKQRQRAKRGAFLRRIAADVDAQGVDYILEIGRKPSANALDQLARHAYAVDGTHPEDGAMGARFRQRTVVQFDKMRAVFIRSQPKTRAQAGSAYVERIAHLRNPYFA